MSYPEDRNAAPYFAWAAAPVTGPQVSIVAPMHNEAGGVATLIAEIAAAMDGRAIEIIAVDDASTDATAAVLHEAMADFPMLRVLRHKKNAGQSRAVRTGVLAARSGTIVTLDGDGQNDPADIPGLVDALVRSAENVAMVAGERQKRQDSASKRWASGLANGLRKRILQDSANDTGCGLKAFYREAFLRLPYFDHMHRYLPALMIREGFEVDFRPVSHRARAHGQSKYTNLGRLLVAIRDLTGMMWLISRARQPEKIEESER